MSEMIWHGDELIKWEMDINSPIYQNMRKWFGVLIAKEIEAMKFQPNPNHDRHEALIAKTYWEEAKLEAERIARGQK